MKTILLLLLPIFCFSQDEPVQFYQDWHSGAVVWKSKDTINYYPPKGPRRDTLILRQEVKGYGLVIIKGRPQPFVKRLIQYKYDKGSYIQWDADTINEKSSRYYFRPTGIQTFYDYLIHHYKYSLPYGKWLSDHYLVLDFKPYEWEFTNKDRRQSRKYVNQAIRKLKRK